MAVARWRCGRPAALAALSPHRVQIGGAPIEQVGWPVLPDLRVDAGPAAGIETALLYAPGAVAVLCAVDTPFVTSALLADAVRRVHCGAIAAAPFHEGLWHPLCGACAPALLPHLTAWLDDGRRDLQALYKQVDATPLAGAEFAAFGEPGRLLMNVNTPAELERAAALL